MDVGQLNATLLIAAAVLLVAVAAVRVSTRLGLPTLLMYLALGLLMGENGLGIDFSDAALAQSLGFAALVVILIEGGFTTRWHVVRPAVPAAALLATVGVAVSAAATGAAAGFLLGHNWRLGALCGAVLSSTDAAAVFATLRRLHLPERLRAILEAESGFNDAPVVLIVVALSAHGHRPVWETVLLLCYELAAGVAIGVLIGFAGVFVLRRQALPATGLYPLTAVGFAVLAYAGAAEAGASGFLAVYLAALVLGNANLPHRLAMRSFSEGLAWLAQIGLFVMLGLLASPSRLPGAVLPAIVVGLVLLLVARPLSIVISVLPLHLSWREQGFLSWAGLRGAVPIVLATIPLTEGIDGARKVFDLVFVLVVIFTLVQAPALPWMARKLRILAPSALEDLGVEAAPLDRLHADLLHFIVPMGSRLNMVEMFELRLPPGARVLLIIREGRGVVPDRTTPIARGDELLVVSPAAMRHAVERRFRLLHELGRTAPGWYGDPSFEAAARGALAAGEPRGRVRRAGHTLLNAVRSRLRRVGGR